MPPVYYVFSMPFKYKIKYRSDEQNEAQPTMTTNNEWGMGIESGKLTLGQHETNTELYQSYSAHEKQMATISSSPPSSSSSPRQPQVSSQPWFRRRVEGVVVVQR